MRNVFRLKKKNVYPWAKLLKKKSQKIFKMKTGLTNVMISTPKMLDLACAFNLIDRKVTIDDISEN